MNRTRKKRLQNLTQQIEALPLAPEVEVEAFERFRSTGELPEHQRLAEAVVKRALRGETDPQDKRPTVLWTSIKLLQRVGERLRDSVATQRPLREQLFNEAVYGPDVIGFAARSVIEMLVAVGMDVVDPEFVDSRIEMPDFGSLGLHLLGWPDLLVQPPYKNQARRLLKRIAILRERIDRDDRQWFNDFDKAAFSFLKEGVLPDDELMRDAVLANGELMGLIGHYLGKCDAEVMAAFDQVARAQGKARAAAIVRLQAMAAEGRLLSREAAVTNP